MENLFQFGITLLGIITAFLISSLASKKQVNWVSTVGYLLILGVIVGIANIEYNEYATIQKLKTTKDYLFKENLVGTWIENFRIDTVQFYSIGEMSYNLDKSNIIFKGTSYDKNGIKKGSWNSTILYVDSENEGVIYLHDGQMGSDNLSKYGYGKINYQTKDLLEQKFYYGDGFFADEFTNYEPVNFKTDRLTKEFCLTLIGKKQAIDTKSKEELIKSYHKYLNNSK